MLERVLRRAMMRRMKEKSIEDLLERVKSWPAGAQRDLAQAVLSIEANLERGAYDEPYVSLRRRSARCSARR